MNTELVRQALRLIAMLLVTTQWLPAPVASLLEHPDTAALVSGIIAYVLAETGWLASKVKTV